MEKKTKLTISGTAKKSFKNIEIAKTQGKNSVVIEKQPSKFPSRGGSSRPGGFKPKTTSTFNRGASVKPSFAPKSPPITNDFERRKLAEQRATKRLKGDDNKDKKTLKSGTKFTTLDSIERELHAEDIMICDGESNPMCIAGVFGGEKSGVTDKTTSIFLESAYFNPVAIRKTAKRHALNTDASFRFERGIDINFTKYALKRAALLIKEYANGKIASDVMDFYPEKMEDFQVFFSYENAFRLIGQELDKETIKNINEGTDKFNQNMEALKHNFLTRSYFRKLEREQKKSKKNNE